MTDPENTSTYVKPDITLYGQEHVDQYRATDGAVGHDWCGTHCLVLTTTGRKSGELRDTPIIYGVYGESVAVVASYGGAPKHPAWYLNLESEPHVEVQVLADRFKAIARTAQGDERDAVWKIMTDTWPNYDEYAKRTDRVIPVVILDRDPS